MDDNTSALGDSATASSVSEAPPATPTPSTESVQPAEASPGTDDVGTLTTDATAAPGPVPYERFTEVNARMKAAEERWRKAEEGFGEILGMDPQSIRGMLGWYRQAGSDPVQFATELLNNLVQDENYRPKVASQAARILGSLKALTPKEEPEPQPDLVAENGTPVFSAPRLREWREWDARRSQQALEARLSEALKPVAELKRERQQAQIDRQVSEASAKMYREAQTWHGFKEHEPAIAKAFNDNPTWDLKDAYLHVLHTTILPKLPVQAQAKVVADLQSKAAAQTMNPAGTAKPQRPDFGNDFEKALEWAHNQQKR